MRQKINTVIIFALLLTAQLTTKAQLPDVDGDWFLAFIDAKHIDTGRQFILSIKKSGAGYSITHPQKSNSEMPAEGMYTLKDRKLINGTTELRRIKLCLLYEPDGKLYEFRSVRIDSIMSGYVSKSHQYLQMADTAIRKKQEYLQKGIYYARKGADMDDICVECLFNLSVGLYRLDKIDSAAWYIKKAKEVNENFPPVTDMYTVIGNRYVEIAWEKYGSKGKYAQAIAIYKKALAFDSTNVNVWYNLGGAYYTDMKAREAAAAFRQALLLSPDDADARKGLDAAMELLKQ